MSIASPNKTSLMDKLQQLPAWGLSLLIHVGALVSLAFVTYTTGVIQELPLINSYMTEEEEEEPAEFEDFKFSTMVTDEVGNDSDLNKLGPSLATAQFSGNKPESHMEQRLDQEIVQIQIPQTAVVVPPSEAELTDIIKVSGETEHTGGVKGAIDRVTFEIATSLKEKPTLVVWLMDSTISLQKRRDEVASRFENIYKQLGIMGAEKSNPLKTGIVSFSKDVKFLTETPTSDVAELLKLVKTISPEPGFEHVFSAIDAINDKWTKTITRNGMKMMIVIITDERGDDVERLDEVINQCKRYGTKVYCLGNSSLFGKQKDYVLHKWKEGTEEFEDYLDMDTGPESLYPELLNLDFWGTTQSPLSRLSAEYGPYGLTRICAETGGLYLLLDSAPNSMKFDFSIMRACSPDYRPVSVLQAELQKHPTKNALLEAILATQTSKIPIPTLQFRADTDTRLRQEITDAQRPVAEMEYRLNEILQILRKGERSRPTLVEGRWRASYDLAMGRALAMQARFFGYNAMVAEMKVSPKTFTNPKSNQWVLRPSREIGGGMAVTKLADEASKYLKRVIDEHPGTPWQLIAAQELSQPMGWEWKDSVMTIAENILRQNRMGPQFAPEEEQMRMRQMQDRPEPKAKPKL